MRGRELNQPKRRWMERSVALVQGVAASAATTRMTRVTKATAAVALAIAMATPMNQKLPVFMPFRKKVAINAIAIPVGASCRCWPWAACACA